MQSSAKVVSNILRRPLDQCWSDGNLSPQSLHDGEEEAMDLCIIRSFPFRMGTGKPEVSKSQSWTVLMMSNYVHIPQNFICLVG